MSSKYHNRKIMQDGAVFDSVKEHRRWCELKVLERAGKISDLRRQVKYELIPVQREPDTVGVRGGVKQGKVIEKPCCYIADFVYVENGAKKYGAHNVDKGLNTSSFADSALRHIAKWVDGWTDEPHLLAAAWNILWAIQMELKHPELCDIPWEEKKDD